MDMKSLEEIRKILSERKEELRGKYGVIKIGVFGSYARKEQRRGSDIDILVEFERPIGLKFVSLADELEEILGEKVEIVSLPALEQRPRLLKSVMEDLTYV